MIEENPDRHFAGLGNFGKPSRDRFIEIDLAVLDEQMKSRRDEGLGAARDPEEVFRSHRRLLEFIAETAREVGYVGAGHADGEGDPHDTTFDMLIENVLHVLPPIRHVLALQGMRQRARCPPSVIILS